MKDEDVFGSDLRGFDLKVYLERNLKIILEKTAAF